MSIVNDLKTDVNMSGMIDKLCEHKQISRDDACNIIRGLSLSEYIQLEASVDLGNNAGGLGRNAPPAYVMADNRIDPSRLNTNDRISYYGQGGERASGEIVRRVGTNGWDIRGADGRTITVNQDDLRGPDDEVDTALGAVGQDGEEGEEGGFLSDVKKGFNQQSGLVPDIVGGSSAYQKFKGEYDRNRNRTEGVEEEAELARIKELAGIESEEVDETSSAGATGAGGIASMPSVVGDTAHRPTDTLRANQRRKKRKKKK